MAVNLYFVLGNSGAHRRAVLADLVGEGLMPTDRAVVLLSETEVADAEAEQRLEKAGATLGRWEWAKPELLFEVPEDATHVFVVADGRTDPIDQLEGLREWLLARPFVQLARVIFVADAALLHAKPELQPWFDACVHYADVVAVTKVDGLDQKWLNEFEKHYRSAHCPFLLEVARKDVFKNPAVLLVPEARRVSQVFDEDIELADETDEEIAAAKPENDKYFARTRGGSRVEHLPRIAEFL